MQIKSFYANTVEAAVAMARRELGPEAVLVQSRHSPLEARHLGEYEVVCALVPEPGAQPPAPPATDGARDERWSRELAELRKQLETMGKTITRSAWNGSRWSAGPPAFSEWQARLTAAELDDEFAQQVLEAVQQGLGGGGEASESIEAGIVAELRRRILAKPTLSASGDGSQVVALVGPPGAGKTTLIAKLAVTQGLQARRPVRLISMDDYRIGGADQLRSYALILGAGFEALETGSALAQYLAQPLGRSLILIDTPGFAPRDMDRAAETARCLAQPRINTHLVLTASMKSADLTRVVDRFELFHPSSLLFTRLDETDSFGSAFSLAAHRRIPVSFLAAGQEIPDDLEPASSERLVELLWPQAAWAARSAA
jgi:flagellar biosynthesis protein FlhF